MGSRPCASWTRLLNGPFAPRRSTVKMPSDLAYWLISVPLQNHDPHQMLSSLSHTLLHDNVTKSNEMGQLSLPPLKTGTLESLISLSEDLPKYDTQFTGVVAKIVDILRNLLNNDADALSQHIQVNEQAIDDYLLGWTWNGQRYRTDRSLRDLVESLNKVSNSRCYLKKPDKHLCRKALRSTML